MKGHLQDKTESVSDLKEFISNYPEFKKISGTVSKHVTLVSELSKEVKVNNLLEISELEQTIACGDEKDNSISQLQKVLSLPNIRTKDALRLVALYTMRYTREVERNLEVLCRSVKGVARKDVYDVIQMAGKYSRLKSKDLLPDFVRGRQRGEFNYLRQPENANPKIIVFFIGGVTYEETRSVAMFNKDNDANVVIGGTSILSYDAYMESMRDA